MTKLIAWYLPQFYTFPENDAWWGKGFTEWTLLRRWAPLFDGHRIRKPHPDIGEYSLLSREYRKRQGEMAKSYGIYGFCYYHCWFSGKLLLEKPMELMLADGEPNIPFCFDWTNQSWDRRWDGHNHDVLQAQTYGGQEEWDQHLDYLLPFFRHRNYIKVDGKPMFLVHRLGSVPDYAARFSHWTARLHKEGFAGLHLVMALGNYRDNLHPLPGVDAVVDFFPNALGRINPITRWIRQQPMLVNIVGELLHKAQKPRLYDTPRAYKKIAGIPQLHANHYRGIFSGWDNSPRVGRRAMIYTGLTPDLLCEYLRQQIAHSGDFVFVNAWNEWSEGAVLEPDEEFGYGFLEAVAKSV